MICTVGSFCALSEFDESINFPLYELDELDESVTSYSTNLTNLFLLTLRMTNHLSLLPPFGRVGVGSYILYSSPAFIFRNLFTEK
jgi:hypothetical protein